MKVYVYPIVTNDANVIFRAITETGDPVLETNAVTPNQVTAAIERVKEELFKNIPEARAVFVQEPEKHPDLSKLLAEASEKAVEKPLPKDACSLCLHTRVCMAFDALVAVGAKLSYCPHFISPEEEEENAEPPNSAV